MISISQKPGWTSLVIGWKIPSFQQRSLASRMQLRHGAESPYTRIGDWACYEFNTTKELDLSSFDVGDLVDVLSARVDRDRVFLVPLAVDPHTRDVSLTKPAQVAPAINKVKS